MRVCPFDLRFRFVLEDDVEELRALYKECFPVTYPNSWFNDLITNPALISFVALANHRIVAILVAKIITLDECSGEDRNILDRSFPNNSFVAYILSLGVSVAYRSHGIASYLLDSFVSYASGSHYLRMCPHAKTKLQSDDVANGRAIIQHHESLQSVPLRPPVMFSPRDRPYHYNKSYRSLVDVLNMLPPFPPSCCAIYLHVLRTNYAARHFYENRGFRSSHVQLGCYTIAGKPADGCTYVFYMNGGFASEDVVSCPTTYPYRFITSFCPPCDRLISDCHTGRHIFISYHSTPRSARELLPRDHCRLIRRCRMSPYSASKCYGFTCKFRV